MKDDFSHKIGLFRKYIGKIEEKELVKRLGLKDWEYEYIRKRFEPERDFQKQSGK